MVDIRFRLLNTLSAVCPILSINIGTVGDSSSVAVQYDPAATAAQQATAQSTLASFDWSDAASQAWDDQQHPERMTLRDQATQAVTDINTFLALASPTSAQTLAMVQKLCQDTRAIIKRLVQIA